MDALDDELEVRWENPVEEEAPDAAGRGDEDVVNVEVEEEAETGEEALR